MSLSRVIGRLGTGTYTVTSTPYTVVNGIAVNGTPTTSTIEASIQHMTSRQLRDLPEGQSVESTIVIYSLTTLQLRTPTNAPDIISFNGHNYRITKATHYPVLSNFYVMYGDRIDVP